jgi:hypothetical protein
LSDWGELALTEQTPARRVLAPVTRAALPELLATRFGLHGFVLDRQDRLVPAGELSEARTLQDGAGDYSVRASSADATPWIVSSP